ncbi:hypothetical protein BN2537_3149 [Streptomyces venezuelae]|nr:hypothetical protein BN2537_3149 [Streptomyces venezuelae]
MKRHALEDVSRGSSVVRHDAEPRGLICRVGLFRTNCGNWQLR